ncbi:HEAT INTOLERANT 4-like [Olea europaea subsp. europaea]|uniref:HEAT INTOLERANT 4-like n=1 Tax=Olea europaea subsp. europaea TaxID=158383 RepID=A0A8S0RLB7_OLEEU|nr:HEAT INTOLERANT 4-like [Olea europaea subsp. europaea]
MTRMSRAEPSQSAVGSKDEQRKPSEESHIELNEPAWEELSDKVDEEPNKKAAKGRDKKSQDFEAGGGGRVFSEEFDLYQPLQEDELEQSTVVQILFPIDPKPEFTDKLTEEEELSADQKDAFKDFVKEKVQEAKKANREAREARRKALEEMSAEVKAAFQNMKFYKFYPVSAPDTPDISSVKVNICSPPSVTEEKKW